MGSPAPGSGAGFLVLVQVLRFGLRV